MSHPELLKKGTKRGVQGPQPLPGFGVSPKNLFSSFSRAPAAREKEEKEMQGRPLQPPTGARRPCGPRRTRFSDFVKIRDDS
jgi:hypothetical protein